MELRLEKKKLLSDSNLRLLSNLIISLSNSTASVQERCVEPYEDGKVYQAGVSLVLKDSELYFCKITNQDATWNPLHWELIGKDINEVDLDTVKSWINLTPEQITNLQSLIDDTSISTTHTNSSSHIYMAIQDAIAECKDETLKQIAKRVSGSYKIANTTADIVSTDYIYLLSNGTNYDLYVLVDGTATKVGDTNIDLSDYAKISDLDEYLKSADADGKYATITTVDGKMDNKTIATLIGNDNVETHDQLVSAKAAAELKRRTFSRPSGESILDYADSIDTSNDNISVTVRSMDCPDAPYGTTGTITNDCYYTIHKIYATNDYCVIEAKDIRTNNKYIRMKTGGIWYDWVGILEQGNVVNMCNLPNGGHSAISSWVDESSGAMIMSFDLVDADDKVCRIQFDYVSGTFYSFKYDGTSWNSTGHYCVTKVNDVPTTVITNKLVSSNVVFANPDSYASYCVKNGTCYVTIWSMKINAACSVEKLFEGLPKSMVGVTTNLCNGAESFGQVFVSPNNTVVSLNANASVVGKNGYCSFSYPVAE